MNLFVKRTEIHPEDGSDMMYWMRKWGVSRRQINDAILETGSIDQGRIKKLLKEKGILRKRLIF